MSKQYRGLIPRHGFILQKSSLKLKKKRERERERERKKVSPLSQIGRSSETTRKCNFNRPTRAGR